VVAPREEGVEYSLTHRGDRFLILTNRGGAKDFKIVSAPVDDPRPENWSDAVPHKPGTLILGQRAYADYHVRLERENALPRIVIKSGDGEEKAISFDEAAYALRLGSAREFETDMLRFTYESPTTPSETYDYTMTSGERVLRKRQEVPSGHNPDDYVVERVMAPAHDGDSIPVTIVRHKDTPVDGSAAMRLYGYGSYGITIPAGFSIKTLSLLDRGVISATAHIRGGQAKGRAWYEAGKLERKENTFKDFIAVRDHLVAEDYAHPDRIAAHGGSAGGLLVGAVVNMAPEKFAGVAAEVPFVDVVTTISDADLPLTPPEWTEWGNPIENEEAYQWIKAYSPYDNVSDQSYPPILATAGLTDYRVTYWEPAKWIARLRERSPSGGPYFMKTNMGAGHGGSAGRFDALKEDALVYAFMLKALGVEPGVQN